MSKWLIVHSTESYNTNSEMIGFNYQKADKIKPNDYIIYYLRDGILKGLYKVSNQPWGKEPSWSSQIQIKLQPIKVLKKRESRLSQ